MYNLRKYLIIFIFVCTLTASAGAQVRFDIGQNPYTGSGGVSISVGNNGYYQQPYYNRGYNNSGYAVYPPVRNRSRRGRPVVVAPYYPAYNQGYNQGYYNPGYNNGYVNNGYYNPGYNQGYYNPSYGYYNNGRCR